MSWQRFSYICRRASNAPDTSVDANTIATIQQDRSADLYGDSIEDDSLAQQILNKIAAAPQQVRARQALAAYAKLDVARLLAAPLIFKQTTLYLSCVALVFLVVSVIYGLFVAPAFIESYALFGLAVPNDLLAMHQYWPLLSLIILLLLAVSLIISRALTRLFTFKQRLEHGFVLKFLVLAEIKASYKRIVGLLLYPVNSIVEHTADQTAQQDTDFYQHLTKIDDANMDVVVEIQALIELESQALFKSCNKQMRFMQIALAILIILMVYLFLSSIYSQITFFGEIA